MKNIHIYLLVIVIACSSMFVGGVAGQENSNFSTQREVVDEAEPGEEVTVSISAESSEASRFSIVDVFSPKLSDEPDITQSDGAFNNGITRPSDVIFQWTDNRSKVEVEYKITIPENTTPGTTVEITSDTEAGIDVGTSTINIVSTDGSTSSDSSGESSSNSGSSSGSVSDDDATSTESNSTVDGSANQTATDQTEGNNTTSEMASEEGENTDDNQGETSDDESQTSDDTPGFGFVSVFVTLIGCIAGGLCWRN